MASPRGMSSSLLIVGLSLVALSHAGPLGPLPEFTNVTSSDLGHKEGSCAVGDVVYMAGDNFPGSGPCERCACDQGVVNCTRERCEPRAGCKALHRPDQCCPTYQCECEQEGRIYGNGEKLVDPADPCRVCYCQGGEVVCRRIACFLRDDCKPRLVPGRCCPEYDNCPLRGVTVPGATLPPNISPIEKIEDYVSPTAPKDTIKQEITIKEITPVSEIPVITEVKIKEILPSPGLDVAEYSSSKSPLIPREATSEKNVLLDITERPMIIEIHPSSSSVFTPSSPPDFIGSSSEITETKSTFDVAPSRISLSTQDSINSDIYPSHEPSVSTAESSSVAQEIMPVATTTKPPSVLEEEEPIPFDHNPAFPPIPDDLSVQGAHQEETNSDSNIEVDHVSSSHTVASLSSTTKSPEIETHPTTITEEPKSFVTTTETPFSTTTKIIESPQNPMLNLRSAIPTDILNIPSYLPEDITGELDDITETTTASLTSTEATPTNLIDETEKITTDTEPTFTSEKLSTFSSIPGIIILEVTSPETVIQTSQEPHLTSSFEKSNIASEITAQTEFSSLPIETSDQNPHEETKEKLSTLFIEPTVVGVIPTKVSPSETEVITVSREIPYNTENQSFDNVETTEFVLTSFGSSESVTDAVELIKITPEGNKNAAIIEPNKNNNLLTDLINLVGDVASINDHTEAPAFSKNSSSISDSEELIPVNAGYKSKNSNWNLNSITETVPKSKSHVSVNKQKVIEIEDDESDGITDSPPPHDKIEPTTRRPIIDNVSDEKKENKTNNKDIEIIAATNTPAEDKRPTKVIMKDDVKSGSENLLADVSLGISSEVTTESRLQEFEETTAEGIESTSSEIKVQNDGEVSMTTSKTQ